MNNQAAQTMPELPKSDHWGFEEQSWLYTDDQMHQYARDYAAALSQTAGVADGWMLVPVEPTPEMVAAFSDPDLPGDGDWCRECWAAMLAAAPSAPAASGGESAASVSERARELLAAAYADAGAFSAADTLLRTAYVTDYKNVVALRALEQALTQQRWHGTTGSMEQAEKATFIPCDCGCGRSCCAMCGNDVGFISQPSAEAVAALESRTARLEEALRRIVDSIDESGDPQWKGSPVEQQARAALLGGSG